MKTSMLFFGEPSLNFIHGIKKYFVTNKSERNTLKEVINEKPISVDIAIIKLSKDWYLGERGWISKKTIYDIMSYLNQHATHERKLNVRLFITNKFGTYDIDYLVRRLDRSFKKLNITGVYINNGNDYIPIIPNV